MDRNQLKQLSDLLAPPLLLAFKFLVPFFRRREADLKTVAILKLRGFGDVALMYPVIELIKNSQPESRLIAIATPQTQSIFKACRDIDDVLVFDPLDSDRGILGLMKFLYALRRKKIGIFLDFSHNFQFTPFFSVISGARHRIGLAHKDRYRGNLSSVNVKYDDKEKVIYQFHGIYESYCSIIKVTPSSRQELKNFQIPIDQAARAEAQQWIAERLLGCDRIIGIHTGSGGTNLWRRWPSDNFFALITELLNDPSVGIILTGSGDEKKEVLRYIEQLNSARVVPALNLRVNLFFALIGQLDCFVSNDSGPLHIGTLVGTYTIGLFGPESPNRYGPIHNNSASLFKNIPCSPCIQVHKAHNPDCHNLNTMRCLREISVREVLQHTNQVTQATIGTESKRI